MEKRPSPLEPEHLERRKMKTFLQSIRFRIMFVLGICVVLMGAIGFFGIFGLSILNRFLRDTYTSTVMPIIDLNNIRARQSDIILRVQRIADLHDPSAIEREQKALKDDLREIDKAWNDYFPSRVSGPDERIVADRIQAALPQLKQYVRDIASSGGGNLNMVEANMTRSQDTLNMLSALILHDIAINQSKAKQFSEDSEFVFFRTMEIALTLVIAGILLSLVMSYYLLRMISRSLHKAVGAAVEIANGKLDNRIQVDCGGEFGLLLESLACMDRQLSGIVRVIKVSAESVMTASREIASGNTYLSARTEEQAASLEETAASMIQLTETVSNNSDNARHANTLVAGATDLANRGNDAVQAMVGAMECISSSSARISDITGVIESIAFQTNILALNAAVEAARAGEQGRGFAVVAGEVRSLAQRAASAAKEIKELVVSSASTIQEGTRQAIKVDKMMSQVKHAIKQVSDVMNEIATASDEQSRGIHQITQTVTQMDEITQQNAALVEQAAAAAHSLEQQADQLKTAVAVFDLATIDRHNRKTLTNPRISD
jgi:methyl-accepting chemotaxis protein